MERKLSINMFEQIQNKCPWKDADLWRNNADMCSANNRPCCERNCAIFHAIVETQPKKKELSYKEILQRAYKMWNRQIGSAHLFQSEYYATLSVTTGGWPENEGIIDALREDAFFWKSCCTVDNTKNGIYKFEVW